MRRWLVVLLTLLACGMLPGCGGGNSYTDSPAGPPTRPEAETLTSSGVERTYTLVRPDGQHLPAPVIIFLHGAGAPDWGATAQAQLGIDDAAKQQGVVMVYPDGVTHGWHIGCCYDVAADPVDKTFVADLIDHLITTKVADPDHIVLAGFSAGAMLAEDMGCTDAGQLAVIVSVAGDLFRPPPSISQVADPAIEPCRPTHPVSVVEIHGTADQTVPMQGITGRCLEQPCGPGQHGYLPPATEANQWWREIDRCDEPISHAVPGRVGTNQVAVAQCAGGTFVGLVQVTGEGHSIGGLQSQFDIRQTLLALAAGRTPSALEK